MYTHRLGDQLSSLFLPVEARAFQLPSRAKSEWFSVSQHMHQLRPQNLPMRIPLFSCLFLMPIICLLSLSLCISAVSSQCLGNQQSLLLQLKNSFEFDNASSTKLVHWNQSVDCCSWEGVTCNEGRVTGLDLTNESIFVELDNSSSLFSLQHLENLSLAYNSINGEIPSQFDKLTNLSYLNLSQAALAGQIPIAISHLTRLVLLDLSYVYVNNMLHPRKLENPNLNMLVHNLSELIELYLDGVNISAQGYEWGPTLSSSLPKLRVLSMSNCLLSGPLDSSLTNLQSLSNIRLDENNFSAPVPEFFADFKRLMSLDFSYSHLNGKFPEKILHIPTLHTLSLSGNKLLQGSLLAFPSNGSLQMLELRDTNFSGTLPHSIGNLKMLSKIDLSGCNFNGSIPKSMSSLTQLHYLDMSNNNFVGLIPSFSMGKNLTTIDLSNNDLTGQITSTRWEELLNLEVLDLSYNSLDGPIPMSLFSLPSLQDLTLSNNQFSGRLNEFPIISSHPLWHLDLSRNNLEGPIPMSIFELRSLWTLSLSWNNFNGSLHLNLILAMRNLSDINLSYNNLVIEYNGTNSSLSTFPQFYTLKLASCELKTLPQFLINQDRLMDLDLSHNQIHGEIHNWILELPNLNFLNLSYNYLETLDLSLLNRSLVGVLDLRSNQLQGQLLGNSLDSSDFLSLSSNKFYGSIPGSICNSTTLKVLDLSNNFMSGTIPQCLFKMSDTLEGLTNATLKVLNLRRNNFTGTISNTFSRNCGLQTLDLNGNQLEGKLPKSLAKCTSLEVLDLGNNHIEDAFPCFLKNISRLHVLVLRSNKFYGPIDCPGPNASWPMLQIVDLVANNFVGKLPIKHFSSWKAIMDDKNEAQSQPSLLRFEDEFGNNYYQDVVTVTVKGQQVDLVKILTIFTALDFSCNNFDGPIYGEIGELKLLRILNLSHNAFIGQIPQSLGKLSNLESLDLSRNELTGKIPFQLADNLTFLSVLNLSFNQLVGKIPQIKQFATFSETSYEGNIGLCGFPLKEKCTPEEPGSSPPTSEETHLNYGNAIDWNFLSAELGFIFGFVIVIGPLMFWKRWRICYYKHVDDMFFKMFPQLYIRIENRHGRAHRNQRRRH